MSKRLKGEGFLNRYRITGHLTTAAPLHIGTGEESDNFFSEEERKRYTERLNRVPKVSTIVKDFEGKPLIPGSSLRGVMRHWLLHILGGVSEDWAAVRNYDDAEWLDLDQEQMADRVKQEFSWLELLFGTPYHAGKLEVWDARCVTPSLAAPDSLLNWNPKSLTYVDTSVAIDPTRGTALNRLLYKTEIVPPGVKFELNLAGQNLSEEELGMVLFALRGFNSAIYPIRIGARGGRGYGRVTFVPGPIYCLDAQNLSTWIQDSLDSFAATDGKTDGQPDSGYYSLPQLDAGAQQALIDRVKSTLLKKIQETTGG